MKLQFKAIVAALVLSSASFAQTPPPPPSPDESGPDEFLSYRSANQAARGRALGSLGKANNLNGLRSTIRATLKTRAPSVRFYGDPAEFDRQQIEEVALFLASLGYAPNDVNPGKPGAPELIESASKVLFERSTLRDEVKVAPNVVVGEIAGYKEDSSIGDGFRSTVTFKIVEVIKGGTIPGASINLRQQSGLEGAERIFINTDFSPQAAGQFLLFISADTYNVYSAHRGGGKRASLNSGMVVSSVLLPYRIEGTSLLPTTPDQETGQSLADARAAKN
jgi:hypothetical protein